MRINPHGVYRTLSGSLAGDLRPALGDLPSRARVYMSLAGEVAPVTAIMQDPDESDVFYLITGDPTRGEQD